MSGNNNLQRTERRGKRKKPSKKLNHEDNGDVNITLGEDIENESGVAIDDKQKRKEMKNTINKTKRIQYAFTAIYSIITAFIIVSNIVWLKNISVFQSGILAFTHVITGVMISTLIIGNTMKKRYKKFVIFRAPAITIVILSIISIMFALFYTVNIIAVFIYGCPSTESAFTVIDHSTNTVYAIPHSSNQITTNDNKDGNDSVNVNIDNNSKKYDKDKDQKESFNRILIGVKNLEKQRKEDQMRIDKISDDVRVLPNPFFENDLELSMILTNHMCTQEMFFMIFLTAVLVLIMIINGFTIYYYIKVVRSIDYDNKQSLTV